MPTLLGGKSKKPKKSKEPTVMEEPEQIVVIDEHEPPPPPKSKGGLFKSLLGKKHKEPASIGRRATVEDVSDAGVVATTSLTEGALKLYNDGGHHHHHHHEPSMHSQDYVEDHMATREHTLVPGGGLTDDGGRPRGTVLMLDRDSHHPDGYHLHDSPQDVHHRLDGSSSGEHGGYGGYGGYTGGPMLVRNPSQRTSHTHHTQHSSGLVLEPGMVTTYGGDRMGDSPVFIEHPDRHPSIVGSIPHGPLSHRHPSITGSIPHGPLSHKASIRSGAPVMLGGPQSRSTPPEPRIVETPNGTFQEYSGNVILVVDEGVELEIGNEETGFIPYEEYLKSPAAQAPPPQKEEVFVVQGGKNMIFQDEHGNVIPELLPDESGTLVPRSGTYQRNVDGSITIWR